MLVIFAGCKIQAPMYAPIEDVLNLNTGLNYDQVVTKMGMKPYDLLTNQRNGIKIYLYYYKNIERKIGKKAYNKRGFEKVGPERYNNELQSCFLAFDSIGNLESITTMRGKLDALKLILINNTIYVTSKDKGKYILTPISTENCDKEAVVTKKKKKSKE